jgi:hypothetical protein
MTLTKFEAPVVITTIPNVTISNIELKVIATLDEVNISYKKKQISLLWFCEYYTLNDQLFSIATPYCKEQLALETIYIAPDGSTPAWSYNELLEKFGMKDEHGNQTYDVDGNIMLTRSDLMDAWSFYMKKSTQAIPLRMLFEAAGNRAAIENRLNTN